VLPLPLPVRITLAWLAEQLQKAGRTIRCGELQAELGELFRTDAKGEAGRVVLGGWCCEGGTPPSSARWFSLELGPLEAPWLFRDGNASPTIAAAELLATKVAVQLFVAPGRFRRGQVRMVGTTDNLGNCFIVRRMMSTKMPVSAVLMQLASDLQAAGLWLDLQWTPRELNSEADALTNQAFDGFNPELRVPLTWEDVKLDVVSQLLETEARFREEVASLRARKAMLPTAKAKFRKRRIKSVWGLIAA
jgi:hypothetical protein